MQNNRSPIGLRSQRLSQTSKSAQKSTQLSNSIKIDNSNKNECNIQKPTTAGTKTTTAVKTVNVANQIAEIKQIIAAQQQQFNSAIESIQNEIDKKCTKFASVINLFAAEIEDIKATVLKHQPNQLQPFWRENGSYESIKFMLSNSAIKQVENQYQCEIDEIRRKIDSLETLTKQTSNREGRVAEDECECEFELFDLFICKVHPNGNNIQSSGKTNKYKHDKNIDYIIKCLQDEVNQVSLSIQSNEIKSKEICCQLSTLSSMFTEFDAQLNKHFHKINGHCGTMSTKSNTTEIKKQIKVTNHFMHGKKSANRFEGKFNRVTHSKHVVVRMNETNIRNLNEIPSEFQRKFEQHTNKNIVQNINILKYKILDGIIYQIDVMVSFNVPVSSNYLNDMMFPCNWTFFEINKQQNRLQSKYPVNHQSMNPVKSKNSLKSTKPRKKTKSTNQ